MRSPSRSRPGPARLAAALLACTLAGCSAILGLDLDVEPLPPGTGGASGSTGSGGDTSDSTGAGGSASMSTSGIGGAAGQGGVGVTTAASGSTAGGGGNGGGQGGQSGASTSSSSGASSSSAASSTGAGGGAVYTLDVVPTGSGFGSVASMPMGITCGATCSAPFADGTNVTLVATPSAGSVFTTWGGDCSGGGTCMVTMDAMQSVTAEFTQGGGPIEWWKHFGGSAPDVSYGIATGPSGEVAATGYFFGTVGFGGQALVSGQTSAGFLTVYSTDGTYQWGKSLAATGPVVPSGVSIDGSGNVIVTGLFQGDASFGGATLTSAGEADIFVAKYSPAGTHIWSKRFGGVLYDQGIAVATNAAGDIAVGGDFRGTVDFGGGAVTSNGDGDAFLMKISGQDGAYVWARTFGGTVGDDSVQDVGVTTGGDVVMIGDAVGSVNLGNGNVAGIGGTDVVIGRYASANGSHVWSKRTGGAIQDAGRGIAVDAAGDVLVTGGFELSMNLGTGALTSAGSYDVFMAKISGAGVTQWAHRYGDIDSQVAVDVGVSPTGDLAITGALFGTINFGGPDLTVASNETGIFAAKFDASGAHLWSEAFTGTGGADTSDIKLDPLGAAVISGNLVGDIQFGGVTETSAGNSDVFMLKLGP